MRYHVVFTNEDMKKLSEGRPVYADASEDLPAITFFTEEGYKRFQEFWGEEDEDAT